MKNPTYEQQFDKITRAYIANELNPYEVCGCFVGILLNGNDDWICGRDLSHGVITCNRSGVEYATMCIQDEANGFYTLQEVLDLEKNFMALLTNVHSRHYEDCLFIAMESTLEMLKQIHISKGEVIDEVPVFEKRKLCLQTDL
jgi:hypothetical protein